MILREISDTSIIISLFRYLYRWYEHLEQKVNYIYQDSQTNRLIEGCWEKTKICFRYSFLVRISEINWAIAPQVLDNSRAAQHLVSFYKRWKDKVAYYLGTSLAIMLAKDTKEELISLPVRVISIIIGIALTVNVFLSIVLRMQIDSSGWLMRGLFLLVVLPGLFCPADWSRVKRSSIFIRKFWRD